MNAILRKSVRSSAALAGTLALALSLAACGGGSTDDAADKPAETQEETTEASDAGGEDEADSASADEIGDAVEDEGDDAADDSSDDDSDDAGDGDDTDEGDESGSSDGSIPGLDDDITDGDLKSAKSRTLDLLDIIADDDMEKACGYELDPSTGKPYEGITLKACVKNLDDAGLSDQITPELLDQIDDSMIEAEDQGDGSVSVTLQGTSIFTMVKAQDGKMYVVE